MTATAVEAQRRWAVGDELTPLALPPISRTTLALFAGGSGDHNPIHLDIDVARQAGLDDVFAQGMLSMAYLGRFVTDTFPSSALRSFTTRFAAITPVGAQPTCYGQVAEVTAEQLTLQLRVELADGTVTLTGQAIIDTTVIDSEESTA
jgi:acyl dehydratase